MGFILALSSLSRPTIHTGNMGIIDGLWRKQKDADRVIKIRELLGDCVGTGWGSDGKHVTAHRAKKDKTDTTET